MNTKTMLKVALALALFLALWGCSSSVTDTDDRPSIGLAEDEVTRLPDHPLLSSIDASPVVVAPGSQVELSAGSWISGSVTIHTPAGDPLTTEMNQGVGSFPLPGDAPTGLYLAAFEDEDGSLAFGRFRVADEPGVWVTANRKYASVDQHIVLSVTSYDMPADAVAAVYLGPIIEGALGPLVPDENGRLLLGAPVPLVELSAKTLTVPGGYDGEIQVGVQRSLSASESGVSSPGDPNTALSPPERFDGWTSNLVATSACDQPGSLQGDFGGPGFVNAIWADGFIQSTSTFTPTGSYSMVAGPGTVLVQFYAVDGETAAEPQVEIVELGCGEVTRLSPTSEGLSSVYDGPALAINSASNQRIGLMMARFRPLAQASGEEPCRTGMIFPRVNDANGINFSQSTLAGLALKTAMNDAANQALVLSMSDAQALAEAAVEAYAGSGDQEEWDSAIEALASMAGSDFVINLTAARIGQRYGVETAALPWNPEDAQVRAGGQGNPGALFDHTFDVYTTLAEKFRQAAICGSAEPERALIAMDEEVAISYRVTDLGGEGADGANVQISAPSCGRLDPESGDIEGDTFKTRFTFHTQEYCAEDLEFKAEWSGPHGTLKTMQEETIVRISPQLPELKLYAGAAPGIGNTAALASAITLHQDYDVQNLPPDLPIFIQDLECGFLEGGLELTDQTFYTSSETTGKRAHSTVSFYTSADYEGAQTDVPAHRVQMLMELDTSAFERESDNVIRGAWASAANASDPNLTRTPGTLLVFDIQNPGNLPVTPIVDWHLGPVIDDASGYSVLVFYKVLECGDDPGIDSLFSFVADGDILLESDSDIPGPPSGFVDLREFEGDRQQIIMWVTSLLTTASIRDDDSGADVRGRARLIFSLNMNLGQVIQPD
jgi:hypothetical protein